jgi:hypothetical protein
MIVTLTAWVAALVIVSNNPDSTVDIGVGTILIDVFALYIAGAYLGVFPTI